ncbi:repressor [Bordetella pseudohinzii]|nr:repressor [Bordetella pseudohinzii]KMM24439.1 repressor [Bordetella pseudohinzii]KXA80462.1 repressor [Bordetella pseudohinzii]KXA80743.1 repressor [Bordetella pseudohinzii]
MNEVELNEFRMSRLLAAVEHVSKGNKTDFGRRLGYKDGAFVRQMLSGIRPVTEKTVWAIEAMPGMKGWFEVEAGSMPAVVSSPAPSWPFPEISEEQVRALPPAKLNALQGAMALAIAQMNLGITIAPPPKSVPTARGSLVDINQATDEFPMRIPGLPGPWEGGKTTKQMEREGSLKLSLADSVIANVAAGDPPAANDRFEKVPELADVRLSAGDGIEADGEEQTGMIQFRRSFLRSVGADGGRGRVVYAKGDSMEPIIRDGAALLVVPNESLTLRDLAAGGVYAINYDGKMIVKTVVKDRISGRWVARSFNPAYADVPLENGHPIRVLGQVVWAGARLRDDEAGQWVRS